MYIVTITNLGVNKLCKSMNLVVDTKRLAKATALSECQNMIDSYSLTLNPLNENQYLVYKGFDVVGNLTIVHCQGGFHVE